MVKAVEVACGKECKVMGKPSTFAFELIKREHGLKDDGKFLMTGDNLETDIKLGQNSGIDTLLVLSGVTEAGHKFKENEARPTHIQPYLNYSN
mgnify:CR=1 FL=1|jgi:ribonucleotide monophosphatase NagD (HAD superfamily)